MKSNNMKTRIPIPRLLPLSSGQVGVRAFVVNLIANFVESIRPPQTP